MTRNGKIARLPRPIRDELNRRLDDGQQGTDLVDWLNRLPEVQRIVAESFGGRPITDGNISEWKLGGFLEWKALQESCDWARMVSSEADQVSAEAGLAPLSDRLSPMVSLALGKLLRDLGSSSFADSSSYDKFMLLLKELARLRRDDHCAARLRMDLESFELNLADRLRQRNLTSIPRRSISE
jgi:hypothetical protein